MSGERSPASSTSSPPLYRVGVKRRHPSSVPAAARPPPAASAAPSAPVPTQARQPEQARQPVVAAHAQAEEAPADPRPPRPPVRFKARDFVEVREPQPRGRLHVDCGHWWKSRGSPEGKLMCCRQRQRMLTIHHPIPCLLRSSHAWVLEATSRAVWLESPRSEKVCLAPLPCPDTRGNRLLTSAGWHVLLCAADGECDLRYVLDGRTETKVSPIFLKPPTTLTTERTDRTARRRISMPGLPVVPFHEPSAPQRSARRSSAPAPLRPCAAPSPSTSASTPPDDDTTRPARPRQPLQPSRLQHQGRPEHHGNVPPESEGDSFVNCPHEIVLVATSLSDRVMEQVRAFAKKFGARVDRNMGPRVTHVICKADKQRRAEQRTLKYLHGLLNRRWLVSSSWITGTKIVRAPSRHAQSILTVCTYVAQTRSRTVSSSPSWPTSFKGISRPIAAVPQTRHARAVCR